MTNIIVLFLYKDGQLLGKESLHNYLSFTILCIKTVGIPKMSFLDKAVQKLEKCQSQKGA